MSQVFLRACLALALLLALVACGGAAQPAADGSTADEQAAPTANSAEGTDSQEPPAPTADSAEGTDSQEPPAPTADSAEGTDSQEPPAPDTSSAEATSHGGPVKDQVSLIDHLRGKGLTLEIAGEVQQSFLSAPGTTVRVGGDALGEPAELQVYNYASAAQAEADAAQIGPDGQPKTAMVNWMAPPHFFRTGQVIVLYVGDDQQTLELLTQVLGPQFAGQ